MDAAAAAERRVVVTAASICLDTSTCIDLLRRRRGDGREMMRFLPERSAWLSSVALSELSRGVYLCRDPQRERRDLDALLAVVSVKAFDAGAAEVSGRVAARLERRGVRIGPLDLLIGAHALALGAVLLTANPSEFARIDGLSVVDSRADR